MSICSFGFGAAAALVAASVANAGFEFNGVITADNHYALFSGSSVALTFLGGNELGTAGSPGDYNWSIGEAHSFDAAGPMLYIAAWSDDDIAQGVLAQLMHNATDISSGIGAWQVYATNTNRGNGDPYPTTAEMLAHIVTADAGNLWQAPFIGGLNGVQPEWPTVPNISTTGPRWMWLDVPGDSNPLSPGSGIGEMLIFRIPVPTPGAASLLGLGALALGRRRR